MFSFFGKAFRAIAGIWFIQYAWDYISGALSLIVPIGKAVVVPRRIWWILHVILVAAAMVGLYFLQKWLQSKGLGVRAPWPELEDYWLVILGLTIYAISWILWWIWRLLIDDVPSYHPDIDAAWEEAKAALQTARIDLRNRPLFLILGRPESGERNLFDAAELKLEVKPTPADPRAPLRVCADNASIFVTCVGVSLLGRLAGVLALEEMGQGESVAGDGAPRDDGTHTIVPSRGHRQIVEDLEELGKSSTTLQRRRLRRAAQLPLGPDFLADPAEVRRRKSRLGHLCRLIARDREPFCPINAIMLLVPMGGTDTDRDAQQTADAAQGDLETVRNIFQLECPLLTVLGDMETLPGFGQFMQGQSPEDHKRRLGQRYPLATNLRPEQTVKHIRESIAFLSNDYVQQSITKHFRFETAEDQPGVGSFFEGNSALVLLMDEMRMRAGPLGRVIEQAVAGDKHLWRYGGCYLAATGDRGQQAFVPQLFERLFKDLRNCVNWTDQILNEDVQAESQRRTGYILIVLAWVAAIAWVLWELGYLFPR
ncbi:MAG: hypothetical protein L0Y71_00930 [Gemmataceae bacterium]|nr:hypothetical protein [Gemmataceae bacterium]